MEGPTIWTRFHVHKSILKVGELIRPLPSTPIMVHKTSELLKGKTYQGTAPISAPSGENGTKTHSDSGNSPKQVNAVCSQTFGKLLSRHIQQERRATQLFRDLFTCTAPQAQVYNLTGAVFCMCKSEYVCVETASYPDRGVSKRSHLYIYIFIFFQKQSPTDRTGNTKFVCM